MYLLLFSLLALISGPLFYEAVRKRPGFLGFIDGFVFLSISGLLLQHILPHIYTDADVAAFSLLLLGFFGPNLLEHRLVKAARQVHKASLIFAVIGLLVHALVDGAGLMLAFRGGNPSLHIPLALIVHRIPVGLTLWWLLVPAYGKKVAWSALIAMLFATVAGYVLALDIHFVSEVEALHLFEAFVIGTLLHVVFFRVHLDGGGEHSCCGHHEERRQETENQDVSSRLPVPEALGNLLAFFLLLLLFSTGHTHHSHEEAHFFEEFLSFAYQTAPALCAAYLFAGLLQVFMPKGSVRWLGKGGSITQAAKGVVFGLPLPICSCGVLPFYKSLVDKKVPVAAGLAFLIATPEIGIDALLISLPLLGVKFTMVRLVAAAILAFLVAYICAAFMKSKEKTSRFDIVEEDVSLSERFRAAFRYGLVELVDTTGPWIILGVFLAVLCTPLLDKMPFAMPYHLDVIGFALVGVVVYVCATGATPFVAILVAAGLSPGAALAFLLTGPATNVSTFGVLSALHSKKFALTFALLTSCSAILLGILVNIFFPDLSVVVQGHVHDHHDILLYQEISLYIVGVLFFYSIYRRGLRKFLSEVI